MVQIFVTLYARKGREARSALAILSHQHTISNLEISAKTCARVGKLGHSAPVTHNRQPANQTLNSEMINQDSAWTYAEREKLEHSAHATHNHPPTTNNYKFKNILLNSHRLFNIR